MASNLPSGKRVSDYDYELPPELIAQYPTERRDESRLLVVPPDGPFEHRRFPDLVELLQPTDVLVVNESRVVPARLLGRKPTGAQAEVLLVRPLLDAPARDGASGGHPSGGAPSGGPMSSGPTSDVEGGAPDWSSGTRVWEALVRPGGKLKPGRRVVVAEGFEVEILDTLPSGNRVVRLDTDGPVEEALEQHGRMPLPPYIERSGESSDRERYQTVYARRPGSIAAPTAGLHFTDALLERIAAKGVGRVAVTLHVGIGTFRPVEVDDPEEHEMHAEWYSVSPEAAEAVNRARDAGGRVWAVGTTAVRTLESAASRTGVLEPGSAETRLFIRPPYDFRVVDGLVTNFHLPRSTLLMLVAALAGYERTMAAYEEAIRERYRFYSYGDAMAVLPSSRG